MFLFSFVFSNRITQSIPIKRVCCRRLYDLVKYSTVVCTMKTALALVIVYTYKVLNQITFSLISKRRIVGTK